MGEDESKENHFENDYQVLVCDWCQEVNLLETQSRNLICPNCYHKLVNAGISDEEIFKNIHKTLKE